MPALLLIVNNIVLVSYIPRTSQAVPWKFSGCSAAAQRRRSRRRNRRTKIRSHVVQATTVPNFREKKNSYSPTHESYSTYTYMPFTRSTNSPMRQLARRQHDCQTYSRRMGESLGGVRRRRCQNPPCQSDSRGQPQPGLEPKSHGWNGICLEHLNEGTVVHTKYKVVQRNTMKHNTKVRRGQKQAHNDVIRSS